MSCTVQRRECVGDRHQYPWAWIIVLPRAFLVWSFGAQLPQESEPSPDHCLFRFLCLDWEQPVSEASTCRDRNSSPFLIEFTISNVYWKYTCVHTWSQCSVYYPVIRVSKRVIVRFRRAYEISFLRVNLSVNQQWSITLKKKKFVINHVCLVLERCITKISKYYH